MTEPEAMEPVMVCRRWRVLMPHHRAQRPGWSFWEQERLAYMWATIRPGDVVWEIGAEIGDVSVLYATWGADVVAVEPERECWPVIERVFEANEMLDRLVGQYRGSVAANEEDGQTLDRMLDLYPPPDVVSIDIEGGEYQALLGADTLLAEVKPIMFISVHPDMLWDQHKDTPDDVWMHLELHGYEVERLGRDHEVHCIGRARP